MNNLIKLALLATALPAANASAATITYTDRGVVSYLQQFNPLLGTLNSVTFNNRYVLNNYYNYNDPTSEAGPLVTLTGTLGQAQFGQININEAFQSYRQSPFVISVTVDKTVSATFADDLGYYTGFGLMPVAAFNTLQSGYSTAITSFPSFYSYVSVTYDYAASVGGVPEPGTWVMMMVGFAMVGGAVRYRPRNNKVNCA